MNDDELTEARERLAELEEWMQRERLRVALHEVGHAACHYFFGARIKLVSIRPGKTYRAIATHVPNRRKLRSPTLANAMYPPLWPAATRRAVERKAICALAGPAAETRIYEFLGAYPASGFYGVPADELDAQRILDAPLARTEREYLGELEAKEEPGPTDLDFATEGARILAGPRVAHAQFVFCKALAAEMVHSDRFDRIGIPLVEELLAHDVVGGKRVHEIFAEHDDPAWTTK